MPWDHFRFSLCAQTRGTENICKAHSAQQGEQNCVAKGPPDRMGILFGARVYKLVERIQTKGRHFNLKFLGEWKQGPTVYLEQGYSGLAV